MKFKIKATVKLDTELNADHLQQILQPENTTTQDNSVTTYIKDNQVITDIKGKFSVGSLLRTVDDILQTATLAENVAISTEKN